MPELRVIDSGVLKGFVVINPRWAGFKEQHYYEACRSVYDPSEMVKESDEIQIEVQPGDFDLRGFEITRSEFFETTRNPNVTFNHKKIKFSTACVRKFDKSNCIELLINPISRKFAIRPTTADNRCAVVFSKLEYGKYRPKDVSTAAFSETVYSLFGWNTDYKYRILGSLYEQDGEIAYRNEQFAFPVKGINIFFLEVDFDAVGLEFTHCCKAVNCVSCKTADRLCNNEIDFACQRISDHFIEAVSALRVRGGNTLIGVYLYELPFTVLIDVFGVIVYLSLVTRELFFTVCRNTGVGGNFSFLNGCRRCSCQRVYG